MPTQGKNGPPKHGKKAKTVKSGLEPQQDMPQAAAGGDAGADKLKDVTKSKSTKKGK